MEEIIPDQKMQEKLIGAINALLKEQKLNRKQIYEHLLCNGTVSPNSERLILELINYGIYNHLIDMNKILKYKKKRGKLPEVFTIEQLTKLFDSCNNPKLCMTMWLGFFCGLRIREACSLRIRDIDLQSKILHVRDSKNTSRYKEGYGKDRTVAIPDVAISPIKRWLDIIQGGEWFIPSMQSPDRPIRTKTIHEQYRMLLESCCLSIEEHSTAYIAKNYGVKKNMHKTTYVYRFHTLRHTYATYLREKNVPLEVIQKSLGHEELDTTLIYAKLSDKKSFGIINDAFTTPMRLMNHETTLTHVPIKANPQTQNITADEILKQRLARGEIDPITFHRLMAELHPDTTINVVHTT